MMKKEQNTGPGTLAFAGALCAGGPALEDFPVLIGSAARVKEACARANAKLGRLPAEKAEAISKACREAADGRLRGSFPVGMLCGYGKPVLCNISEVIAARASGNLQAKITPADVDLSQGTLDVMGTAAEMAVNESLRRTSEALLPLEETLLGKAREFSGVIQPGRIGMRDGLPVALEDVFRGFAAGVRRGRRRLEREAETWRTTLLGAGDYGTGLGVPQGFADAANGFLSEILGRKVLPPESAADALEALDRMLYAQGALESTAARLREIARGLEILSSGPRAGIREMAFPAVAPGSSIMPGKINPTVAQLMELVADQISAGHAACASAALSGFPGPAAPGGTMLKTVLESAELLARTAEVFRKKVLEGLAVFPESCRMHAESSLALARVVELLAGREAAERTERRALQDGISCREAALREGILGEEEAEKAFDLAMLANAERSQAFFAVHGAPAG